MEAIIERLKWLIFVMALVSAAGLFQLFRQTAGAMLFAALGDKRLLFLVLAPLVLWLASLVVSWWAYSHGRFLLAACILGLLSLLTIPLMLDRSALPRMIYTIATGSPPAE